MAARSLFLGRLQGCCTWDSVCKVALDLLLTILPFPFLFGRIKITTKTRMRMNSVYPEDKSFDTFVFLLGVFFCQGKIRVQLTPTTKSVGHALVISVYAVVTSLSLINN